MAFVKIYNGQHKTDLGLDVSWRTNMRYNLGGKNLATRKQLDAYFERMGQNITERVGLLIHPKSVEFCYREGDNEAEFQARCCSDKFLKDIRKVWCDSKNCIDPLKVWSRELI